MTLLTLLIISALRGRVYLPQDELAQFGLCDKDVFSRNVSERWRKFMKHQITRARFYFNRAEEGVSQLEKASRWPVGKPACYLYWYAERIMHFSSDILLNEFMLIA